ncbi:MAG: hypothetical protein E7031_03260 [Akkermansiaceae bacterium]|nr:hypothetical protein [Akkermansiaceae bacterium]
MQNEKIHKRGRNAAEFKEKVALEALTGAKTHAQIASEYGISPDLVKDWKKQAKEMLGECLHRGGRKSESLVCCPEDVCYVLTCCMSSIIGALANFAC